MRRDFQRFSCVCIEWRWFHKDDEELVRYALGYLRGLKVLRIVDRRDDCLEELEMSDELSYERMWDAIGGLVEKNASTLRELHVSGARSHGHTLPRYAWWSSELAMKMSRLSHLSIASIRSDEIRHMHQLHTLQLFNQTEIVEFSPENQQIVTLHFTGTQAPMTLQTLEACSILRGTLKHLVISNSRELESTTLLELISKSFSCLHSLSLKMLPSPARNISPLSSIKSLRELDISNSQCTFDETLFSHFKSLTIFVADNTRIGNTSLLHLAQCPLTAVSLRFCQFIEDEGISAILSSSSLESIDLSSSNVTDNCILLMTEENHGVTQLHLSNNSQITDSSGEKLLTFLPSLIKLYISGTRITDKTISALYASPFLRTLYISNNPGCTYRIGQYIRFMRVKELSTDMEGNPESFGWIAYQDLESLRITSKECVDPVAPFIIQSKTLQNLEVNGMAFTPSTLRQIASEKTNLHSLRLYLPFDDPLVSFLFIHTPVPEIAV